MNSLYETTPTQGEIYAAWGSLVAKMRDAGYVLDTNSVLHDVVDEQKKNIFYYQSEKLAIVFGRISIPYRMPMRIV